MDAPTDVDASKGPPTRFCWKVTNGTNFAQEPGGWTGFSQAWPICTNIQHVIFVFQRRTSAFTARQQARRVGERFFAANALIAIRMHQILRLGGQVIPGNTLLYCMTINREGDLTMPSYPDDEAGPALPNTQSWFGFIETLERVATINIPTPPIHLVSRSLSSITCKLDLGYGWLAFMNRPIFAPLMQDIRVVYQVPNRWYTSWPAEEKEVAPYIVPFTADGVLPIKYVPIPLLSLVRPRIGVEPAWYSTLRKWIREEDAARTQAYPIVQLKPILKIREAVPGSGGACGSTFLNRIFRKYLEDTLSDLDGFGEDTLEDALVEFENITKRRFIGEEDFIIIRVPGLADNAEKGVKRQKITIKGATLKNLFTPVMTAITTLVKSQLQQSKDARAVILVGGFGQSPYLRNCVKQVISDEIEIMQPVYGWTAVVRGSLLRQSRSRISLRKDVIVCTVVVRQALAGESFR
ncbi:hypothetical protein H2200_008970 [Cladophialophora chaetospira]|uniref:Uncharacterized protein n=1 Tax=Cladophialophora chaetospira TaxID=386627 RepID=A0AA38X510_9EURO|nr:hypothetical protein H2200_008970 [Cladophialophora chaetospira]